jgi:cellobiose-specific phosphotransferase system component IIB
VRKRFRWRRRGPEAHTVVEDPGREEADMARVLLVCVAGVSGTFLAQRMRAVDPDLEPVVAPIDALGAVSAEAVLLAPQLADRAEAVRTLVAPLPVGLLPASAFGAGGAQAAAAQARELLATASYRGIPTTETKE